jgi:hypothetical protein
MKELKYSHPFCYENMCMEGQWTVQRQAQHSFASIACDQAIEQTVNRDTKSTGGLRGISLNRGWFCYILTLFKLNIIGIIRIYFQRYVTVALISYKLFLLS